MPADKIYDLMENSELLKKRIAELESSERELIEQVNELRDFVENASVPLQSVNGSGIVIWVNKAGLDLLGYKKEELINQHISKFHADKHVIEDILHRLINRKALSNYPARLLCKDGSVKHVLINSNTYWKDSHFGYTRCFMQEVVSNGSSGLAQKQPGQKNALLKNVRELQR